MSETSEPSGRRQEPPPMRKVARAASDSDPGRLAVLYLSRQEEEEPFRDRVVRAGIECVCLRSSLDLDHFAIERLAEWFVTDILVAVKLVRHRCLPGPNGEGMPPMSVVVVANSDQAVLEGWQCGADWVIARPVDEEKLAEFGRILCAPEP